MRGVPDMTLTNLHETSLGLIPPSTAWSYHRDEHTLMGQDIQQIWHTTRNPLEHPFIQPNYLASEADIETLVAGFKLMRSLADTKAFAPFVGKEFEAGPRVKSDEDIGAFIRNKAETLYHPVGTCKMGVDAMAVVDPQLRVHGIQGLRVADASIMPLIPNGNTNVPSIMIGEKAAELMKTPNG